ncbi:MAG: helix-turn-helix transcriptional regulator [Planctomycetaceae bacterium]
MEKSIYTDEYSVVIQLLKELRKSAGVTQVQIAEKLGQSQSLFSKYERGELRLDVIQLRTVAQTLGLTLVEFAAMLETRLNPEPTPRGRPSSRR